MTEPVNDGQEARGASAAAEHVARIRQASARLREAEDCLADKQLEVKKARVAVADAQARLRAEIADSTPPLFDRQRADDIAYLRDRVEAGTAELYAGD